MRNEPVDEVRQIQRSGGNEWEMKREHDGCLVCSVFLYIELDAHGSSTKIERQLNIVQRSDFRVVVMRKSGVDGDTDFVLLELCSISSAKTLENHRLPAALYISPAVCNYRIHHQTLRPRCSLFSIIISGSGEYPRSPCLVVLSAYQTRFLGKLSFTSLRTAHWPIAPLWSS